MNIDEVIYSCSVVRSSDCPDSTLPEFLLLGRSNVGKSSFINSILKRKKVAYISSRPGKTQTLNFYMVNKAFYFVDAPGYGYAKVNRKIKEQFGKMIEDYILNRDQLVHIFLLIDLRHLPSEDDMIMYEYLKHFDLPVTVVCTKADKLSNNKRFSNFAKLKKIFTHANLVQYSSEIEIGRKEIYEVIGNSLTFDES